MITYQNSKGEIFEVAFHCRGHVETLVKPGTNDEWMNSEEVAKAVFGETAKFDPETAEEGDEWYDLGQAAAEKIAEYINLKCFNFLVSIGHNIVSSGVYKSTADYSAEFSHPFNASHGYTMDHVFNKI